MLGHMSPVVHPKDWNLIRVPLRKIGDKYDVFVSDDLVRHYDERTLPDVLKIKNGDDSCVTTTQSHTRRAVTETQCLQCHYARTCASRLACI
jgi:hypothetical protein